MAVQLSLRMSSSPREWLRRGGRRVVAVLGRVTNDLLRSVLLVLVLRPAADFLSRRRAFAVARWCGAVLTHVPCSGKTALATMRRCFNMNDADAARNAGEYLAQPFYTYTVFQRLLRHREHPDSWTIEEKNNQSVAQLRQADRSFIVATGHFRRESHLVLYLNRVCLGKSAAVHLPLSPPRLNAHAILDRLQYGQLLRTARMLRPDHMFLWVGDAVRKVLRNLAQPGCQVVIAADSFWNATGTSSYARPFAGMKVRPFSTGAAALARLSQRPIVPCASYVDENGAIVLDWGPVIEPPSREDASADLRTTDTILDFLEKAIGLRPTQYVLHIGDERQWNSEAETWEAEVG